MPTFDIVSKVDMQEVNNALNQARKEVSQRYDLKQVKSQIDQEADKIVVTSEDDFYVRQVVEVIKDKLVRRKVPLKALSFGEPKPAGLGKFRSEISMQQGIGEEQAKKLVKMIKDLKLKKVQSQIMGDQLRISGKNRDDLQEVIAAIKEKDIDFHVQFVNFRD